MVATSVRNPLRDRHEHVFKIDLLLSEHAETEAVLHEGLGDEAAVLNAVVERDPQGVVLLELDFEHILQALQLLFGGVRHPVGYGDIENHVLADPADGRLDVAIKEQFAALNNADLVTYVGQLRNNVPAVQDLLSHFSHFFHYAS